MTDNDLDAIRLAAAHYRYQGARAQAIRDRFGISVVRFWQRVGALIDRPDIEAALPVEVHRLQRQRDDRARFRRLSTGVPDGHVSVVASRG